MTSIIQTIPKNPIIVLWAHPRSMSTAIERIMRERGDCTCLHEPLMYYHYVHKNSKPMPFFNVEPDRPTTFKDIITMLFREAEHRTVFSKDMSYYIFPEIKDHPYLATAITHVFLIRDPRKSILSYHKLDPDLQCQEIGIDSQWHLHQWVTEITGKAPLIIRAEDIQRNPEVVIRNLWQKTGLPDMPNAFSWHQNQTPNAWKQVERWHEKTLSQKSIQAEKHSESTINTAFTKLTAKEPHLQTFLDHHLPYHQKLSQLADETFGDGPSAK